MYADMSDVIVREMMALRATCDPMLINERRMVTPRETITEFRGMFHPGVTCQNIQLGLFEIFHFLVGLHMRRRMRMECPHPERKTIAVAKLWPLP